RGDCDSHVVISPRRRSPGHRQQDTKNGCQEKERPLWIYLECGDLRRFFSFFGVRRSSPLFFFWQRAPKSNSVSTPRGCQRQRKKRKKEKKRRRSPHSKKETAAPPQP